MKNANDTHFFSVFGLVVEAYATVIRHLGFLAKISLVPLGLAFSLDIVGVFVRFWGRAQFAFGNDIGIGDLVTLTMTEAFFLLPFIVFVPLLIAWHRKIAAPELEVGMMPSFAPPFAGYALLGALAAITYFSPAVLPVLFILFLGSGVPLLWLPIILVIGHVLGLYSASKLALVFPAKALGHDMSQPQDAQLTTAVFRRLFIAQLIATTPILLVYALATLLVYLPALSEINGEPEVLGAAIQSAMYANIWISLPLALLVAVVFSTCSTIAYLKTTKP